MNASDWHQRYVQQAHWTASLRRYLFERAGLSRAQRILDVGCGTGALLSELCSTSISIHGLDLDSEYLHLARQHAPQAHMVHGDAHHLPYAQESFDIACCHFLLLWVQNPQQVITEMRRVVRPGGCVLALAEPDYRGRIDYPQELEALGQQQSAALSQQGATPEIGRKLRALFNRAKLANVESGVLSGQWQGIPTANEQALEWQVLENDLREQLSSSELAALRRQDQEAWQRGERILFVPTFYAIGWT